MDAHMTDSPVSSGIARLATRDADFEARLSSLLAWDGVSDAAVQARVEEILAAVRTRGDAALIEASNRFDRLSVSSMAELTLTAPRLRQAYDGLPAEQREALAQAAERIRLYHERQRPESWHYTETDGTVLGQQVTALDRAGIYVPGGKAAYPSSVLMNAIPAHVAGVREIIMVVPTPDGVLNELVLAAAHLAGVDRVFTVGGAQAVAALAFGTGTVPRVDKIVGPGNVYVSVAKKLVFGFVDIDMIAGPSEIAVIADEKANPAFVAADMLSQAEHDKMSAAILLTDSMELARLVKVEIERQYQRLDRKEIIGECLEKHGVAFITGSMDEAVALANIIAPEHLELCVEEPFKLLWKVRNAGAVFLGEATPEPVGDYFAGPSHVLPTSGTARFSSPLGVYDFVKKTSVIYYTPDALGPMAGEIIRFAEAEGLAAHANAVKIRLKGECT